MNVAIKTSRIDIEFNTGWIEKHPEIFVKHLFSAMIDFEEKGLINIKFDMSRAGFIKLIAE